MTTTEVRRLIGAPRAAIYRALVDPDAIAAWRVPEGMTSVIHGFDAREGGTFRVSLTYDAPSETGKSGPQTDTYSGRFARLVPDREVVEVIEFEADDPALAGEMTMTTTLTDVEGGTEVTIRHEGLPTGVPPEQNERGTRMALDNLAALVEGRRGPGTQPR